MRQRIAQMLCLVRSRVPAFVLVAGVAVALSSAVAQSPQAAAEGAAGATPAWDVSLGEIWNYEVYRGTGNNGETTFSLLVSEIVLALVIILVGAYVSRLLSRALARAVRARVHIDENMSTVLSTLVYYVLLIFTVLLALNLIDIPLTIFAFLGGALAIGVGFGAQNFVNNFLSGLFLLFEQPIRINDVVELDGQYGRIKNIGWRCSSLRLFSGVEILVPNSRFLEQNVTNWTHSDKTVRFPVAVGVAYGSPTRRVEELLLQAAGEHAQVLPEPAPVVIFEEFGDNALIFTVYIWLVMDTMMDARLVRSDLRHRIDELFKEEGIVIAFPQRDIHFDTDQPLQVRLLQNEDPPA